MSNTLVAGGFRLYSGKQDQPLRTCVALASDSVAFGIGDPVDISSAVDTAIGLGPYVPVVKRATAGSPVYGICQAVLPQFNDGSAAMDLTSMYRKASTLAYVLVRPADMQDTYEITDDGSATMSTTDTPQGYNFVAANPNTTTGLSNTQLAASTASNSTTTLNMRVISRSPVAGNDVTSANARWLVNLNNIRNSGGTGVAGV